MYKTILNVFTIGTIFLLPHAELTPFFTYSVPILLLTLLVLKYSNESFKTIGFSFKVFTPKAIYVGALVAISTLAFMQLIFHPVLDYFVLLEYNDAGLNDTIQSGIPELLLMILLGWLIGGVYEEIVFHGFIFTRLNNMVKGKYATHLSFVISAIIFGLYHYQLGASGLINALIVGTIYLGLYLYFNKNLWYSIFCHGFYNTMVMTLIYFGYL